MMQGHQACCMIITLLLYVDDIILLAKSHDDLDKPLKNPHVYCSKMGMTVYTDKTKVMIIKSKNISHGSFIYDNHCLEQVSSYKYLGIDFPHHINWNYNIEKMIIGGWKTYYELENNCKMVDLYIWSQKRFLFETLITPVVLQGCEVWDFSIPKSLGGRLI